MKEKSKSAEEVGKENRAGGMRDPLIAFVSVEKVDEKSGDIVGSALAEIRDVASKVKAKNITLFPFAHLSDSLADPGFAIQTLRCMECKLAEEGYHVLRIPFGWYKVFEFKSKGHPLAVLSRSIPRKTNPTPFPL